jgi:hypothetical protein
MRQVAGRPEQRQDPGRRLGCEIAFQQFLAQLIARQRVQGEGFTAVQHAFGLVEHDPQALLQEVAHGMSEEGQQLAHLDCPPRLVWLRQVAGYQRGARSTTPLPFGSIAEVCGIAEELGVPREITAAEGLQRVAGHHLGQGISCRLRGRIIPVPDGILQLADQDRGGYDAVVMDLPSHIAEIETAAR